MPVAGTELFVIDVALGKRRSKAPKRSLGTAGRSVYRPFDVTWCGPDFEARMRAMPVPTP